MLDVGIKDIDIKGDSELVVKQLTKEYKCVKDYLVMYVSKALSLLHKFDNASINHLKRIDNQEANDMAQLVSGYKIPKERMDKFIEVKDKMVFENTQMTKPWGKSLK